VKSLRSKLTYANVISTICLFLLLGGGAAYAASQLAKNSVGTKQLKNGSVTAAKLNPKTKTALAGAVGPQGIPGAKGDAGAPATKLWALLLSEGKISRSSGVVSAKHTETGVYVVVFNQDLSACTYVATPATPFAGDGTSSFPGPGEASAGPLEGNSDGVVVSRFDKEGEYQDTPVSLAVFC
jgi:hypothetical protein